MTDDEDEDSVYIKSGCNLVTVVGPRSPFHLAFLQVERKVFDVNVARAAENAMTQPHDLLFL